MKKYLLLVALLFTKLAFAYEGGLQSTFSPSLDTRELENTVKYDYLKSEYDTKRVYSDGLAKCTLKRKYYMPGNAESDSDGCFDVISYLNKKGVKDSEASYIGYVAVKGDFAGSSIYDYADGYWIADKLCRNSFGDNARAARESDLKYFIHEQASSIPNNYGWILFDYAKKVVGSTNFDIYSYASWKHHISKSYNCDNYTTTDSSKFTTVMSAYNGGWQHFNANCGSNFYIMCIQD